MKEEIKLTREQVASFAFLGIIGNVVYSHTYIDDFADRAAWLAALAGILLLIPFAVWILYLGGKHSGCTIFDILGKGIGKIPAGIACIIFIFINAAVAAVQLNMFTEMLKVFFLQLTPGIVIMAFIVLMGAMFAKSGIGSFGRLAEILTLIGIINYFTSFIPAFPSMITPNGMGGMFIPYPVEVVVGGATIFVLDVERFEKA